MRKLGIMVAALVMAGGGRVWAQTNAYVVDITGSIVQQDGTKIALADPVKGMSGLLLTDTAKLVAIVSETDQSVEIDGVSIDSNKIVHTFMGSARAVLLPGGKFIALLGPLGAGVHGSLTNLPVNLPPFGGELETTGAIKGGTKPSIGGSMVGIWNDAVNGDTNSPNATFKGSLKSSATNDVPSNCCASF